MFGRTLAACAAEDERVCAITAAMADGTGLAPFAKEFPDRFFDVAIAEGHGVAMAAGLAKQGMLPVFAVYASFLQRGYDMLIHDVALQHLHVVLGVDRAGLVGADGETHHGCFDALFLSEIPGFTVLCPASFAELRRMLRQALFEIDGPVAVRYPRGGEGDYREDRSGAPVVRLREGEDVTLLTYGVLVNQALAAADLLERQGVTGGFTDCMLQNGAVKVYAVDVGYGQLAGLDHAGDAGFTVLGLTYSPIRGPEGNIEYLGYLEKGPWQERTFDLKALVDESHQTLKEHGEGGNP